MLKTDSRTTRFFDKIIIGHPVAVLIVLLAVILVLGFFAKDFQIDASSETLIQENDEDLLLARQVYSRYGIQDFLVIAYTPHADLLSDEALDDIANLKKEFLQLDRVDSVITILDVPILESPPVSIQELAGEIPTLKSSGIDRSLARIELANSPVYRNLLVSPDLKTTGIQINFKNDTLFMDLIRRNDSLRDKLAEKGLTEEETIEYDRVRVQLDQHRDSASVQRHEDIQFIRAIMDDYRGRADLFLGGISMISDDLVRFVKNDLKLFGIGVFTFLVITLGIIFRKIRWILLPMFCCVLAAIAMIGLLGLFDWEVTVISSNFISLQLIITMAVTIHLVVRYRELLATNPDLTQRELVLETVRLKLAPCIYAALTTIAGFGSLLSCDIYPVITFGWMMVGGIIVSLIITFILFPSAMMLLSKTAPPDLKESKYSLTHILAEFTEVHGKTILVVSAVAFILSAVGISRLKVENSFINYFKENTEIYQGMKVIDQQLGGTTPLDVLIDLEDVNPGNTAPLKPADPEAEAGDEFADFDDFDEFDAPDAAENPAKYWFTQYKMNKVLEVHDYLESIPGIGKVLSLGTMMKMTSRLNQGKSLDSFELSLIYNEIPDTFKKLLVEPYASVENNQVRFFVRVKDSEENLRRNELLKKIDYDLTHRLEYKPDNVHLAGMLVLYNNMLQSLFKSQIMTLGIVVLALVVMFLVLFRSLRIAVIAISPNLLATGIVLGVMGWLNIPLDMMTITIAAISVGIAVDDTIHYIHRFQKEIEVDGDYTKAMHRCHSSIGHAMYYTSLTIIVGFSILVLSNFIPSIIFGLMTGLAMFIALISALTLLPQLIIIIKPFGSEFS
ncbi:MAG: RND family transporter [Desulfobacteraceae bacterium]|nr:RND family transporter [Desulfobacteraceae bacterium]MBC2754266.1 RND family transporter [Desulfobacteraceae bacterium]